MSTSLVALEWPRLLELAEAEALTAPGRALLRALVDPGAWAPDLTSARVRQQETLEISALLDRQALWGPLAGLEDPAPALERLERGSVLETQELALLRRWLYAIDSWAQLPREEIRAERFKKALGQLPDPLEPLRILDRVLTPEGEISERATPRLAQLHAEIRALKREIDSVLDRMVKVYAARGVLQETFTDVRDGRYVIPVKISHQSEIDGNVYEASASRQTVFVEPREVAVLNNRLRQRQNDLVQEVFALLQEVTARLQPFGPEIGASARILSHWDAAQARARLGRRYGGKAITVTEERGIELRNAAHPLLWWALSPERIVRNHIEFEPPARTLLLTGPNTGGKTVFLKMLGLAGLCARTGFPFPGTDQPRIPFFDSFFVDLGDPQSIEQHLSSFSGHVLRFREILETMTDRSLVLVDELNSATDPEEGAALGRAILETLMAREAIIVATTHDPHLKALALSDSRILSASMTFDESSREPTYTLALGIPGRSRALETAERLGLPKEVLELARRYLSREHLQFEQLLARLESDVAETTRARKEAVAAREEGERLRREWTEKTEKSVGELLDKTRQKLKRILEQAQDEVRSSVRKLDEMRSRRELDSARTLLNESVTEASRRIETALQEEAPELAEVVASVRPAPEPPPESPASTLEKGATVRIPKWKSIGQVISVSGDKVKVTMGTLQMTLSLRDVEPLTSTEKARAETEAAAARARSARVRDLDRPSAPAPSLDLRGIRFEEAMASLEHYLDQAFRSGELNEVTIVHGLGTGALREGSRRIIEKLPYVKSFRDGGVGHGGAGATIVEFDR